MLRAAIACDDPVVFFEPKRRYWEKGDAGRRPARRRRPRRAGRRGASAASIRRPGTDVTVVSYGPSMPILFAAADAAADRGPLARGHRSAQPVPARPGPGDRIGAPDRPAGGRLRGAAGVVDHREHRRPGDRGGVLLAGRAGAAGGRLRHPVPAEPAGGRVPARPGQGARTPSTECWPTEPFRGTRDINCSDIGRSAADVPHARRRRGADRGGGAQLAGRGRRHPDRQPGDGRDRDRQGRRRTAVAVRRPGARAARRTGCDGRGRHADHHRRHRSGRRRLPGAVLDAAGRTARPPRTVSRAGRGRREDRGGGRGRPDRHAGRLHLGRRRHRRRRPRRGAPDRRAGRRAGRGNRRPPAPADATDRGPRPHAPLATPPVRKLAKDLGIDLRSVHGQPRATA